MASSYSRVVNVCATCPAQWAPRALLPGPGASCRPGLPGVRRPYRAATSWWPMRRPRPLRPRVDRSVDRRVSKAGAASGNPARRAKRATGIEPVLRAWKALVQPLHHARELHWKAESSGRHKLPEHGRVQRVREIDPVAIMRELGVGGSHSASVLAANRGKGVWRIQGDSGAFALRVLRPDEHETRCWNNAPWTRPGPPGLRLLRWWLQVPGTAAR